MTSYLRREEINEIVDDFVNSEKVFSDELRNQSLGRDVSGSVGQAAIVFNLLVMLSAVAQGYFLIAVSCAAIAYWFVCLCGERVEEGKRLVQLVGVSIHDASAS